MQPSDVAARGELTLPPAFDKHHYFANPGLYSAVFHQRVAPHISCLAMGIYWDRRYPRLLTADQLAQIRRTGNEHLLAVADITCDIDGACDMLTRACTVDETRRLTASKGDRERCRRGERCSSRRRARVR